MKIIHHDDNLNVINSHLKEILDIIRFLVSKVEATLLLWGVFTAGCAIIMTG
jgi:hypothetical protein